MKQRSLLCILALVSSFQMFPLQAMEGGGTGGGAQAAPALDRPRVLPGAMPTADRGDLSGKRAFKPIYVAKNLAWLLGSVAVFHYTNRALKDDEQAQQIQIAKQNIADGFRDMIERADEDYKQAAKRQAAQRYYNVRPPNKEEIERQVEEDRMLADAYRRLLDERSQKDNAPEVKSVNTNQEGPKAESLDEPEGEVVESRAEISDIYSDDELDELAAEDEASERDEQLVGYIEGEESVAEKEEKPKELKPLSAWKRTLYKGLRIAAIGMIVVQLTGLITNLFAWQKGSAYNPSVYHHLVKDQHAISRFVASLQTEASGVINDDLYEGTVLDQTDSRTVRMGATGPDGIDHGMALPPEFKMELRRANVEAYQRFWVRQNLNDFVSLLGIRPEKLSLVPDINLMKQEILTAHRDNKIAQMLRNTFGLPYWAAKWVDINMRRRYHREIKSAKITKVFAALHKAAKDDALS